MLRDLCAAGIAALILVIAVFLCSCDDDEGRRRTNLLYRTHKDAQGWMPSATSSAPSSGGKRAAW